MKTNAKTCADTVTELEVAAIRRDRCMLATILAEYRELVGELSEREEALIERIEAGAEVQGKAWVINRRRQNISWLTVCKRELGEKAVLAERDSWPTTFYKQLRVG